MWQSSSSSTNLLAVPSAKFCFCFWEKVKTYWPTDQPGLLTEVHGGCVCVCEGGSVCRHTVDTQSIATRTPLLTEAVCVD